MEAYVASVSNLTGLRTVHVSKESDGGCAMSIKTSEKVMLQLYQYVVSKLADQHRAHPNIRGFKQST